jgi:hypothetical protein
MAKHDNKVYFIEPGTMYPQLKAGTDLFGEMKPK